MSSDFGHILKRNVLFESWAAIWSVQSGQKLSSSCGPCCWLPKPQTLLWGLVEAWEDYPREMSLNHPLVRTRGLAAAMTLHPFPILRVGTL